MKKFIIIGNMNAVIDYDIFPYIKENKLWLGVSPRGLDFVLPNGEVKNVNAVWYTNIEHKKRNTPLDLYKRYSNEYPKYDNYDAIEVSKTSDIPMDYDGIMGVPITFLDKYCPEQFEIVSRASSHSKIPCGLEYENGYINGKWCYSRILIRKRTEKEEKI